MDKRYRSFTVELSAEPEQPTKIVGYACVFNSPSVDLGGYVEVIKPGAFTDALAASDLDVICNVEHDNNRPLGRSRSGTLRLSQDDHGLLCECDIPETQLGRDITELMRRKDYCQMSFCFIPTDETISEDGRTKEVLSCSLHDVSLVLFPAYTDTEAELRAKPEPNLMGLRRKQLLLHDKIIFRTPR